MEEHKLYITPKTKIFDLLENFPELEKTLIEYAPHFRKLKNPVLRRTITKITTLSQAAAIAGINVEELVNALRKKAGQDSVEGIQDKESIYNVDVPEWFAEDRVKKDIDIRDMLHAGEQPVHEVLAQLKQLKKNEILQIIAPFLPAPLIDKSLSLGYKHYVIAKAPEEFHVYFSKT